MSEWNELESRSGLKQFAVAWPVLERELVAPRDEFLGRPSKNFRGELVGLAYGMATGTSLDREAERLCAHASALLERLHAGSLVVDDIQDDSLYRRGKATLHRLYGIPRAINVGNWLYFDALDSIPGWGLDPARECAVWRLCHRALNRAHLGQGIDLGVSIDKVPLEQVPTICLASLELKTGALTALAFGLGAALANVTEAVRDEYQAFGREFGIALQMLDDLGNLQEKKTSGGVADGKQFEDLKLRRPSWVWATAATHLDQTGFGQFVRAVEQLPDSGLLVPLLRDLVPLGQQGAEVFLDTAVGKFTDSLPVKGSAAAGKLGGIIARLKGAYLGKPI